MKTSYKAQEIATLAREVTGFNNKIGLLQSELDWLRKQQERFTIFNRSNRRSPPDDTLIVKLDQRVQTQAKLFRGTILYLTVDSLLDICPGERHWCRYLEAPRLRDRFRYAEVLHPLVDRSRDIARLRDRLRDLRSMVTAKFGW